MDADLQAFQGHFPGHPVLPGVVQVDWAIRFGTRAFGDLGGFRGIDQLKFQALIRPGDVVELASPSSPAGAAALPLPGGRRQEILRGGPVRPVSAGPGRPRRGWIWLLLVALMAACGAWRCRRPALQTDLLAMLPATERNPVAEAAIRALARATGRPGPVPGAGRRRGPQRGRGPAPGRGPGPVRGLRRACSPPCPKWIPGRWRGSTPATGSGCRPRRSRAGAWRTGSRPGWPRPAWPGPRPALDPLGELDGFLAGLPFAAVRLEVRDGFLAIPSPEGLNILVSAGLSGSAYDPPCRGG